MKYDIIIIGSGPGGYVAAIRAAQLGKQVAVVEKSNLGGVCLNWGCIPTKALLKSAQLLSNIKNAKDFGIKIETEAKPDLESMVSRSRRIAEDMSKGIQFLFRKNKIEVLKGYGKIKPGKEVEVTNSDGNKTNYKAENIIIATGARSRQLPNLKQDGKKIIGYREAMTLTDQPKSMVIAGSGAIGCEFAYFYNSIGTEITLVEVLPDIVPLEDQEVSRQLARSFKKSKIKVMTNATIQSVDTTGKNCKVRIKDNKGEQEIESDIVLSAIGIKSNIEDIGLEDVGIEVEKGKIKVDKFYKTSVDGYYAIGDVVDGPALAHLASHEGITCVEKIAGLDPDPVDYDNIPSCTYTHPEIASVGITEKAAVEKGYDIKVGKFRYTASGKAHAINAREGFVKVIFDSKSDKFIGAHMIGEYVTEMIAGVVTARKLNATGKDIIESVYPHPTMSEAMMEAVADAYGRAIHL